MAGKQARLRSSKPRLTTPSDSVAESVLSPSATEESKSSRGQEVENLSSVEVKKFSAQISTEILDELHRFYLQLQMDLGRSGAPFKEVIAEEAICRFLESAQDDRDGIIAALVERQKTRG